MTTRHITDLRRRAARQGFRALNRVVQPLVRAGVGTPLPFGPGAVVLESVGRVSGQTRSVPLLAQRHGDTVVVSTVRAASQWVRNVEPRPDVDVWVGGRRRPARAAVRRWGPVQVVRLQPANP